MQTKRDIERLLAAAGVSPKHRLGQHFLIDLNLMRSLLDAADIRPDDVVLEVGSGTGSLTEGLADRAGAVVAVECDAELIPILRRRLAERANVTLIHNDALAGKHALAPAVTDAITQARADHTGRLLLVANLPYSIAAPLMANLVTGPLTAETMTVTVQLEVGLRMAATTGDDHYGTLGILLGATGRVEILRRLPPSVFWPRPQVDSVIARYRRDPARVGRIRSMQTFQDVVRLLMTHRRKTLRGCVQLIRGPLAGADWPVFFEQIAADPSQRPERLTPDQYVALSNACAASGDKSSPV